MHNSKKREFYTILSSKLLVHIFTMFDKDQILSFVIDDDDEEETVVILSPTLLSDLEEALIKIITKIHQCINIKRKRMMRCKSYVHKYVNF